MIIDNKNPISKKPVESGLQKLLEDLQGNILKSHAKPHVKLLFLKFSGNVLDVKEWIRNQIAPIVTSMTTQLQDHEANKSVRVVVENNFCSFSLSRKGYDFLQLDSKLNDPSFTTGMGHGTIKNDPPKDKWEQNYNSDIDALLILAHNDHELLSNFCTNLKTTMNDIATVVAEEDGKALKDEKEHFGFADGRSQPRFFDGDIAKEGPTKNWNPFASLNLVLTRDNYGKTFKGGFTGDGDEPVDDFSGDHSYGSYLVFRKLEQDVDGWNKAVVELAQKLNLKPDLIGAFAVGRFQDGTPVINHPSSQDSKPIENDFHYEEDMTGAKCPFHSHIRKANPRGDTSREFGVSLEDEKRRRIARRGIPYVSNGKKGLLFMCYQNSIVDQFDFIQNDWIDNNGFLRGETGHDSVIGQGESKPKTWPSSHGGKPFQERFSFGNFVSMRGGEYFFTPSISFLKTI